MGNLMKKSVILAIFLLAACSNGEMKNFALNCTGTVTDYDANGSFISKESRQYEFDEKLLKEKNCAINGTTILCTKEYISGPKLLTRNRFLYNTGDYSLNELTQTIGIDESKNLPMYVKTVIFQSTCPMTVKRSKQ